MQPLHRNIHKPPPPRPHPPLRAPLPLQALRHHLLRRKRNIAQPDLIARLPFPLHHVQSRPAGALGEVVPEDVGEVEVGVFAPGGRVERVAGLGDLALDQADDVVAVGELGEGFGGVVGAGGILGEGWGEVREGEEEEGEGGEVHGFLKEASWRLWFVG